MYLETELHLVELKKRAARALEDVARKIFSAGYMEVMEVDENDRPLVWEFSLRTDTHEIYFERDNEAKYSVVFRRDDWRHCSDFIEISEASIRDGLVMIEDLIEITEAVDMWVERAMKFWEDDDEEVRKLANIKRANDRVRRIIASELRKIARVLTPH